MDRLSIIADSIEQAQDVGRQLAGIFVAQPLARIGFSHEKPAKYTLVDLNLADSARLPELRLWLERRPPHGKAIFVIEPSDRSADVAHNAPRRLRCLGGRTIGCFNCGL